MSGPPRRPGIRRHDVFSIYLRQCFFINHGTSLGKAFKFSILRFVFMNHHLVATGIQDDDKTANRIIHCFHFEFDAFGFKPGNFCIQIVHLKRDARAVLRVFPGITITADGKCVASHVVFHPHAARGFPRRLKTERAPLKFARPLVVNNGRSGKYDFSNHNWRGSIN